MIMSEWLFRAIDFIVLAGAVFLLWYLLSRRLSKTTVAAKRAQSWQRNGSPRMRPVNSIPPKATTKPPKMEASGGARVY